MSKRDVNSLLGLYSAELIKELSNELSSFYESKQISDILDALRDISDKFNCTYSQAKRIISNKCLGINSDELLEDLFTRSVIGSIDKNTNFVRFKHRQSKKDADECNLDKNGYVIVHSGIKVYIQNR